MLRTAIQRSLATSSSARLQQSVRLASSASPATPSSSSGSPWDLAGPSSSASNNSEDAADETAPLPSAPQPSIAFDGTGSSQSGLGMGLHDWSRSFHGLSTEPFKKDVADILLAPVEPLDVEIKPDGILYLPEIKYRRILNKAFGPGGWGLAPRGETNVGSKTVSREYGLVCLGRLVSVARGEQDYFDPSGVPTATEGCKSNALMRCCKDLGIASELWDPRFIRDFKAKSCAEVWAEHSTTKKKRKLWRRKDDKFSYPYEEKK